MDCPKCKYPNPQGTLYCQMCYEVLIHNASRYYGLNRGLEKRQDLRAQLMEPSLGSTLSAGWGQLFRHIRWRALALMIGNSLRRYRWGILLGTGAILAVLTAVFYFSPLTRLRLYGTHLDVRLNPAEKPRYLVGFHSDVKSWSQRLSQMDTPLPGSHGEETGTLMLEPEILRGDRQRIAVKPVEWIRTLETPQGQNTQAIPLTHPSLAAAEISLDKQGTAMERRQSLSCRVGRCLGFVLPSWPKGTLRRGQSWDEHVEWVEAIGEWKIFWRGRLHWTLKDYERSRDTVCTRLTYQADVSPGIWETPAWAHNTVRGLQFTGEGHGEVLFSNGDRQLLSNTFIQEGLLTLAVTDLNKIPFEQRIGRQGAAGPGDVVFQLHNKLDIRKL